MVKLSAVPVAVVVRTSVSLRIPPNSNVNSFCPPVPTREDFRPSVLADALPPVETKLNSVEFAQVNAVSWPAMPRGQATSVADSGHAHGDP